MKIGAFLWKLKEYVQFAVKQQNFTHVLFVAV